MRATPSTFFSSSTRASRRASSTLAGSPTFRQAIESGLPPRDIASEWLDDQAAFSDQIGEFLHYA